MEGKYASRLKKPGRRLVGERLFLREEEEAERLSDKQRKDLGIKNSFRQFIFTLFYKTSKGEQMQISRKESLGIGIADFKDAPIYSNERAKVARETGVLDSSKVAVFNNFMVGERPTPGVGIGGGAIDKKIKWSLDKGVKAVIVCLPSKNVVPIFESRGFKPTRVSPDGHTVHMFADRKTLEAAMERIRKETEEAKKLTK